MLKKSWLYLKRRFWIRTGLIRGSFLTALTNFFSPVGHMAIGFEKIFKSIRKFLSNELHSLSKTRVIRKYFPRLFAYSAKFAIRMLLKTCKVKIHGLQTFVNIAEKHPCILMLWHNKLILISEIINSHAAQFVYTAFISKSRDGDPLACLTESYTNGRAMRVPHNARHHALSQCIHSIKNKGEIMVITPDGPRGPKEVVKPGIILAARETEAPIFPFSWQAKRHWQLKTWDQMKIPKPFTTIHVSFGKPVVLSKNEANDYEKEASFLKEILDQSHSLCEFNKEI